jgi:alanine racemase
MTPAAYALINLEALKHNLKKVREFAPASYVMAVIKANAYGHGLLRVAKAMKDVDAFAVARVDEGIWLRQAGIQKRIIVLEGFCCSEELEQLLTHNLELVIHSEHQMDILVQCRFLGNIVTWLKLDTGMNRLGFNASAFDSIYQRLNNIKGLNLSVNLMTHLANADDMQDKKTRQQIRLFKQLIAGRSEAISIANSAGVLGWPEAISEWVRPGIMLFGVSPFAEKTGREHGLQSVMSLHSRLIAIKQIKTGERIGYGGTWVCTKATRMGVVAIGYGDGYPRQAVSGTPVLVKGQQASLIGRVSMDMITVDLGLVTDAKVGDPVTLWGDALPVETIAEYSGTIPYTLLCGITQRVQIVEQ